MRVICLEIVEIRPITYSRIFFLDKCHSFNLNVFARNDAPNEQRTFQMEPSFRVPC